MSAGFTPAKVQAAAAVVQFWHGQRYTFHAVSEPVNRKLSVYSVHRKSAVR